MGVKYFVEYKWTRKGETSDNNICSESWKQNNACIRSLQIRERTCGEKYSPFRITPWWEQVHNSCSTAWRSFLQVQFVAVFFGKWGNVGKAWDSRDLYITSQDWWLIYEISVSSYHHLENDFQALFFYLRFGKCKYCVFPFWNQVLKSVTQAPLGIGRL